MSRSSVGAGGIPRPADQRQIMSALIPGTGIGIGLATARSLGQAGHKVYATGRNPSRAPELAETGAREKLWMPGT
jgi:NAD(P)-dependent dehydrogenase (short-subunit alcohol dehydrogenase family)